MDQVVELLVVDVFKLAIPQAGRGIAAVELVIAAGEVVTIAFACGISRADVLAVGGVAEVHFAQLAAIEAQAIDFLRVDHAAIEDLGQQA
ncbi:hypothetical protein FQZ97_916280 [compost metagenome]